MIAEEISAWLSQSLEDRRLSRAERQALARIAESAKSEVEREAIRHQAFEIARSLVSDPGNLPILDWLEDVVKTLREGGASTDARSIAEAYFSPGDECPRAIVRLLDASARSVEICVFTITDDRLAGAIMAAHRRGVSIRIITDDAKSEDLGSDVERFEEMGIPVRLDRSPFHMHHKFAIFDGSKLLTGSYNWTRGVAFDNEENLIVTDEPRLVRPFLATFERLWSKLA
jgi:mitochondrial cardiolipin hydrolase